MPPTAKKPVKPKGKGTKNTKFNKKPKVVKPKSKTGDAKKEKPKLTVQLPGGEFKVTQGLLGRKTLIPSIKSFKRYKLSLKPKNAIKGKPLTEEQKAKKAAREKRLKRTTTKKLPKYYPTIGKPKKPKHKKRISKPRPIRSSIKPGQILILVAGRHRGKRVVFLKSLKSGLLLVTGPFKLNACPLRRIAQCFVIATKTRINIKKVVIPPRIRDVYFKRHHAKRPRKDDGEIFETEKETYKLTDKRKEDQISVDKQIFAAIHEAPDRKMLYRYLAAPFSLRNRMYPHKLIF